MTRPILLAALLLAAGGATAQPARIADAAENYVIAIEYREAPPPRPADGLRMAYVTVTPAAPRARALWDGQLRAIRFAPARAASPDDGVVWLRETERGHYAGYGLVPVPHSIRSASFAEQGDGAPPGYDLNPNEVSAYGDDDSGGGKDPGGDTGGRDPGGDTGDGDTGGGKDPGDDDLVNPWDPDPEPTQPTRPKPKWPDDMGDDLVNPWPGRQVVYGSTYFLIF